MIHDESLIVITPNAPYHTVHVRYGSSTARALIKKTREEGKKKEGPPNSSEVLETLALRENPGSTPVRLDRLCTRINTIELDTETRRWAG